METTDAMEVLRATPLTPGLGHPERRRLARLCHVRTGEPGDVILREGSRTTHLGIVRLEATRLQLLDVFGRAEEPAW